MSRTLPEGYKPVVTQQDPLPKKVEYDAFYDGRELLYLESKRIRGNDGKEYDVHILQNDAGVRRMLFGCAQLTSGLRRAGRGSRVFLRYDGKQQGRKGMEHAWVIAVASVDQPGDSGGDDTF